MDREKLERKIRWCPRHVTGQRRAGMFREHAMNLLNVVGNVGAQFVCDGEPRYASELGKRFEAVTVEPKVRIGWRVRRKLGQCLRKGMTIQRKVKGSQRGGPKGRKKYESPLYDH